MNWKDGYLVGNQQTGAWEYAATDDNPFNKYIISIKEFFKSPEETVDWMAHLYEKVWFKPRAFFECMTSLRAEFNLFK